MDSWVTHKHEQYDDRVDRNDFVDDVYTGAAQQLARKSAREFARKQTGLDVRLVEGLSGDEAQLSANDIALPEQGDYLYKRAQGEHASAFLERALVSRYPDHFAYIVDALVGAIVQAGYDHLPFQASEEEPNPVSEAMGESLEQDATGEDEPYHALVSQATIGLFKNLRQWWLVDAPSEAVPSPRIVLYDDASILDYMSRDGRLVQVKVKEEHMRRASLKEQPEKHVVYTLYTLDGWERYDDDGKIIEDMSGDWDVPYVDSDGQRILPIGCTKLPLPRDISYMMAEGAVSLYNQLSAIYGYMRVAQFPRLAGAEDSSTFRAQAKSMLQGSNFVQSPLEWHAPPLDMAGAAREIYAEDVQEYYRTSFQQLNDAARERTATEIRQQDQRGRQAFLTLLSKTLEQMENAWMWRLAQIAAPGQPDAWANANVRRSRDFLPLDPLADAMKRKEIYFGSDPLPTTIDARADVSMQIQEALGYTAPDPDDLRAQIAAETAEVMPARTSALARLQRRSEEGATNL